jgi:archaellum biogenesis ATPase FlaH
VSNIDFSSLLLSSDSLLVKVPSELYNKSISYIPQLLKDHSICYVTLNKTYNSLKQRFSKEGFPLDHLVFIDAITRSMEQAENTDDCYFVSSPQSLTELSIVISEFLNQNIDYIIIDSLTTLLIYQKNVDPVVKFVTKLVNTAKKQNSHVIFLVLDTNEHKLLIEESSMVMDAVYSLSEDSFALTNPA